MDNDIEHHIFVQRFVERTNAKVEFADQVWNSLTEREQLHPRTSAILYASKLKQELKNIPFVEQWRPDWL